MGVQVNPTHVHVSFALSDLKQIKQYLQKFSDHPDDYIKVFRGLTLTFELDRKDMMLLLNQTLTSSEKPVTLQMAIWESISYCSF